MHKLQLIINEFETRLNTITDVTVIKNRAYPAQSVPAIALLMGPDVPLDNAFSGQFQDWSATIYTDILVQANQENTDSEILKFRAEIHKVLMADHTLGGTAIDIDPEAQEDPQLMGDGEIMASSTRLPWRVHYRANRSDPTM